MSDSILPKSSREFARERRSLASETHNKFAEFSHQIFREGALPVKVKQLIAVAVAHATQGPYCIQGHTKAARKAGASKEEIMEAIWVAAEGLAGVAYTHSIIALEAMDDDQES